MLFGFGVDFQRHFVDAVALVDEPSVVFAVEVFEVPTQRLDAARNPHTFEIVGVDGVRRWGDVVAAAFERVENGLHVEANCPVRVVWKRFSCTGCIDVLSDAPESVCLISRSRIDEQRFVPFAERQFVVAAVDGKTEFHQRRLRRGVWTAVIGDDFRRTHGRGGEFPLNHAVGIDGVFIATVDDVGGGIVAVLACRHRCQYHCYVEQPFHLRWCTAAVDGTFNATKLVINAKISKTNGENILF